MRAPASAGLPLAAPPVRSAWHAELQLHYQRQGERTVVRDRHRGPLRILRSLYPQGPGICHNVIVHPPAGLAGGDALELQARLDEGSHALLTTPGATRFYRSLGAPATQSVHIQVAASARLEWLPLETICHRGAIGENRMRFELAAGAEMMGWDVLALGLPASQQPFDSGRFAQHIELPGIWLEKGRLEGADPLLDSPLGMAGHSTLATLWFAAGTPLSAERREQLLELARDKIALHSLAACSGCTAAHDEVLVLRSLAHRVEPAMQLLRSVWAAWRQAAWQLDSPAPRIWST